MSEMSCPNCGYGVPEQIRTITMLTCPSCSTTLYLEGARLYDAGQSGTMHDGPQLFKVGDSVRLGGADVQILGHARFSYGRGWWDEFWGTDEGQRSCWISVDEGDIVLQYPLSREYWPRIAKTARVGTPFRYGDADWKITERDGAKCIALRGSFGERLVVGETYDFVNASGPTGELLSGEIWDGGQAWFIGYWHDPFTIKVEAIG